MKEHLSGQASPTERTMAYLRAAGFTVVKVEHRDRSGITHDFAGFADLIAFKAERPIIAVQATTTAHLSDRERKIRAEPRAKEWLATGRAAIWLVGWEKVAWGKRTRYEVTVRDLLAL